MSNKLQVGLASVDMTPKIGVPLAGYGGERRRIIPWDIFNKYSYCTYLKPSTGVLDPVRAKAMYLEKPDQRLLFLSLDIVAITAWMSKQIKQRLSKLGLSESEINISATHTHSGSGTLSKSKIWQPLGSDRFQQKIFDKFLLDIEKAVENAIQNREPATLYTDAFQVEGIQKNRRDKDGYIDKTVKILLAKSEQNHWMGGLVNMAIHATALGSSNLKFSADMPGGIESGLSKYLDEVNQNASKFPIEMLFINGAEGDITPVYRGLDGIAKTADIITQEFSRHIDTFKKVKANWEVDPIDVKIGKARLKVALCTKQKGIFKRLVRRLFIPLKRMMPSKTKLHMIKLDNMVMLSWPGEPTAALGRQLVLKSEAAGWDSCWVMGLTEGHLAYFTTREEYAKRSYEACSSLYGKDGGEHIVRVYEDLLKQIV